MPLFKVSRNQNYSKLLKNLNLFVQTKYNKITGRFDSSYWKNYGVMTLYTTAVVRSLFRISQGNHSHLISTPPQRFVELALPSSVFGQIISN